MVSYTITRYTWLCRSTIGCMVWYAVARFTCFWIPSYTWFCIPSLVIHGFVYRCMHGFVCHRSLYMVLYIVYMVLYAITRYTWLCIPMYAWFRMPSLVIHGFVYRHLLYMVMYTNVSMVMYAITRYTWLCIPMYVCMVLYAITRYTWFCIPSPVIHGYVYQCIHGFVCHHSLYMIMYTNVCMVLYAITRYTWLCIYTWFCMPSLVIHGYVYHRMYEGHGFVCHHSLYMVLYTITLYMVLYTIVCYKRFNFRCVMWILNHAIVHAKDKHTFHY